MQSEPKGWRFSGPVIIVLGAILVAAVSAFLAGYTIANNANYVEGMRVFWEAWNLADSEFYFNKPSEQDRIYGAINGMLGTYNDRFTFLMPPAQAAQTNQVMQEQDGGIGATVALNKDGELVIVEVMLGKPAAQAGVENGDVIIAVDGQDIKGMAMDAIVNKIHGPLGSTVALSLRRAGVSTPVIVTVTRDQINTYSKMLPGNIAYVSLAIFSEHSTDDVRVELEKLLKQQPTALIFDLRENPGGYLDQALQIADLFLPEGPIASEKDSTGLSQDFSAHTGDIAEQIPMVVLVSKGSASASEIVSGALQDRQRAVLIGQQTYGKGTVQNIHTLSDGSQLRVTHGAWYTPNHTLIQSSSGDHIGLTPNVVVPLPDPQSDQPQQSVDATLNAAIQYIEAHFGRTF